MLDCARERFNRGGETMMCHTSHWHELRWTSYNGEPPISLRESGVIRDLDGEHRG